MSCEDIGEPELSSEIAVDYLRSVLPEPRGCTLESGHAEHELGSYPMIQLCADPAYGWYSPPLEYVCAYQDLLSQMERAIDWARIEDELQEGREPLADPPDGGQSVAPAGETASETGGWRLFLERFPGAVDWTAIEPSATAHVIRRHLEPDDEEEQEERDFDSNKPLHDMGAAQRATVLSPGQERAKWQPGPVFVLIALLLFLLEVVSAFF